MRKWRNCNPEKNRFNDMRCRVYRNARKIYGDAYSEAKEEYIRSEIERRKQNMIIRNSRRTEWAGQPASSSGSTADPSTSTSPSASPVSSTTLGGVGFQMPESAFMFTSSYGTNSSLAASQQIPAYGATDVLLKAQDSSKPEKQKPDESKFLQDLKENRLPPRRRSRSAMHSTMNNSSSQAIDASRSTTSGVPTDTASSLAFEARGYDTFGPWASYADNITDSFDYTSSGSQQPAFRRVQKQRSATDNPEFGSTGAFGSFTDVMGEGSYQGSYMDSSQQLQMLEHKYNSSSLGQSLFFNKNDVQKQSQQQHDQESLDSVVEAMEISQAVVGTTTSVGGLYGDRDASAWLTPSATYNAHNLADPVQSEHESRGFPFPVIRDRKELARAAGIRLEIPNQHQLKAHHWINAISDTGSGANGDDMVGGSATSQESSGLSHQGHSPSESSPLSAALLSPLRGARYSTQSDDNSNRNRDVNAENEEDSGDAERSNSQYSSHVANTVGIAKTKGSNLDIFSMHSVPMPLYSQSLGSSESGFFTTDASSLGETNYFANYQGVARRHSTAMANLSSL
ncbi:hypothetical protein BC939DRAFT_298323 [Gamsiella multidivaricata]|uniref:uncharacterized protein n=1 Tax=Gamsiella multidivaricata TaxID=101098 RepID=UPI0022203B54|nr:uncharacterized protein BC939DRAFT_298323 [Gamsiella multidivaricata]KAI7818217.1 hypothetical protein BC939DRAFT_298323 [Gamsiella multidivaricata]